MARTLTARNLVDPAFHPTSISGLLCLFESTRLRDKYLADQAAVSGWPDDSKNQAGCGQATGANQPLYNSNSGKYPYVKFDGSNDVLTSTVYNQSLTPVRTMFAIFRYALSGNYPNFEGILTGATAGEGIYGSNGTTNIHAIGASFGADSTAYIDGVLASPASVSPIDSWHSIIILIPTNTVTWTGVQIGKDRGNAGREWNGDIAIAGAFNSVLTGTNLTNLLAYLAGIKAAL